MTLSDIGGILEAIPGMTGKVAYNAFPDNEAPELPFAVYLERESSSFYADNRVYCQSVSVDIELYTEVRAPAMEWRLEQALTDAGIVYTKSIDYLDSERCYMTVYTVCI